MDETTIRAVGRVLRITVIVTATLVGLDTLGVNIAGLMAAGGIGGLAIGLAAKDMIANFFGGLTVFIDRPFSIGDWIVLKDHGIEGVVENIGWRQTTIRKFDRRQWTEFPITEFLSAVGLDLSPIYPRHPRRL